MLNKLDAFMLTIQQLREIGPTENNKTLPVILKCIQMRFFCLFCLVIYSLAHLAGFNLPLESSIS